MSIRLEARNRGNIRLDMDNASLAAKYAREAGAAEKAAELSAANAAGAAERADAAAEAALRAEAGAQSAAVHLPQPGENGTWLVWDQAGDSYVDSGENCTGVQGERGRGIREIKAIKAIPEARATTAFRQQSLLRISPAGIA